MTLDVSDPVITLGLVLATATYAKYVLKWSTTDFIKLLFKELKELLTLKVSSAAVNGAGFVVGSIITVAAILSPKFEKLLMLGISAPQTGSSPIILFGLVLTIFGFTLLCVQMIKPK